MFCLAIFLFVVFLGRDVRACLCMRMHPYEHAYPFRVGACLFKPRNPSFNVLMCSSYFA